MKWFGPILGVFALGAASAPSSASAQSTRYRFEAEEIIGKIHKPEVMMVITRQNLTGTYTLELDESFLPKIVSSVEEKPF